MEKRVVITGLGICAPNGTSIPEFEKALRTGKSGITFHPKLKELNFSCQIGGKPSISEEKLAEYFTPLQLRGSNRSGMFRNLSSE